jgi:D-alanine transaminase
VSRGAQSGRTHAPLPQIPRTVFAFCAPWPEPPRDLAERGIACVTASDTRWARCDIKSTALLANVLLRQLSVDAAAAETILLREGELTEASASAVHVVLGGEVLMPPNSRRILPGTTRGAVEEMAARAAIPCRVQAISEAQLRSADEVWISAATREVQPVTVLDGRPIGGGRPGPLWRLVYEELQRYKQELAGTPW